MCLPRVGPRKGLGTMDQFGLELLNLCVFEYVCVCGSGLAEGWPAAHFFFLFNNITRKKMAN